MRQRRPFSPSNPASSHVRSDRVADRLRRPESAAAWLGTPTAASRRHRVKEERPQQITTPARHRPNATLVSLSVLLHSARLAVQRLPHPLPTGIDQPIGQSSTSREGAMEHFHANPLKIASAGKSKRGIFTHHA